MRDILKTAKILIVDDFSGFRLTLKSMLHNLEAKNIDQASSGAEALNLCSENTYDMIFCDYNLGEGQDGQQILEELHQRFIIKRGTLFMMVTAETTTAQVNGAIEYRPDAYLTKPFTGEQLEKRLNRLLEKKLALEAIYQSINSGELNRAIEVCDLVANLTPKFKFSCLRIKSEIYEELNDHEAALAIYNQVIEEQPLLWAMMGIGKLYFDQGDFHKSKNYFVEIRKIYPRQVSVFDWIAKCEGTLGEIEKAEQTLLEAIEISPKSLNRQLSLGKVAASLEHHDIAQEAFTKTIQEGQYSCLSKPKHFQYYFENSRKAVKTLQGMDKTYLMAKVDGIFKKMSKKFKSDPRTMATNLSSIARLYADNGQPDKANNLLSKLSETLKKGGNKLDNKETELINKNLSELNNDSCSKQLATLSDQLDTIKNNIEQQPELPVPEEEPLIETLPALSFYTVTDQIQIAKNINKQGLHLVEQKKPVLALEKFREAIKIVPDNASYYLNAASIILISPKLNKIPEMIEEAKEYLEKSKVEDVGILRHKRFQALMDKLTNA